MEEFVDEQPGRHPFFEKTLADMRSEHHPSLNYFIYKSIILNNLYGVDIMKEAVEIAKLRLFLKLVSTVDVDASKPNFGLEPLPDIDFNIRAGNTLVGFATEQDLLTTVRTKDALFAEDRVAEFKEEFALAAQAYRRFQDSQLMTDQGTDSFRQAKAELRSRLRQLNDSLSNYLAINYGIDAKSKPKDYEAWLISHQPFHWFAEFYDIIAEKGGFDVIIGNPPYVGIEDIKYKLLNFETIPCGDVYALCIERSISSLLRIESRIGMIVPISITSTDGYSTLRKVCEKSNAGYYFSNFGVRPSKLFDGVDKRLTIFLKNNGHPEKFLTTKYHRWASDERGNLFSLLSYQNVRKDHFGISGYPKVSSRVDVAVFDSLVKQHKCISNFIGKTSIHKVRYTRKLQYFIQFFEKPPIIYNDQRKVISPSELKHIEVYTEINKNILLSALNSSLFFYFFITFSDCRNVNSREILKFPIDLERMDKPIKNVLSKCSKRLMEDLERNSVFLPRNDKRAGQLEIQSFQPRASKPIIDEIDTVLAEHYGFNEKELDHIVNYDIKYRMGKEMGGGAEDEEQEED
ncbi:MAG: hypothetical protein K9J06_10165 [Flavobacteriales bacterium]|nr:hypothetical protein [Flavobacteriales bacterium]